MIATNQPLSSLPSELRTFLVTGAAGFIGVHTSQRLLARGDQVGGVDDLNDYDDVTLKEARLTSRPNFNFHKLDVADRQGMVDLVAREKPQRVIHLAGQASVRYSLTNPHAYIDTNLQGFTNLLGATGHGAMPVQQGYGLQRSSPHTSRSRIVMAINVELPKTEPLKEVVPTQN